MNKYEKAFERVTDWFHAYRDKKGILVQEQHVTEEYLIQREILWELVDKSIAKKPLYYGEDILHLEDDIETIYFFKCPNCNNTIYSSSYNPNFCEECGQKIKWKE